MFMNINMHTWKRPCEFSRSHLTRHTKIVSGGGRVCFSTTSCLAPPFSGNGDIKQLMPPYETFTAFWMLSTFLLNWMFANISHGAGGWHDSPSASLRVILPCNTQGKQICIHCMTNLAVCFHWAGVHNIYFSPHFPFFLSSPLSLCISSENLSMWYFNVIRNIYQFRLKYIFYWIYFSHGCEGN